MGGVLLLFKSIFASEGTVRNNINVIKPLKTKSTMNIQKCLSHDYQSPTAVVLEISLDGVLCQSRAFDASTMENVDREVFEW